MHKTKAEAQMHNAGCLWECTV